MKSTVFLFAHSQELHDESTSGLYHVVTLWPVSLVLYAAGMVLLLWALFRIFKIRFVAALSVFLAISLVVGIGAYSVVPVLSVFAITSGIVVALVFSLLSLR